MNLSQKNVIKNYIISFSSEIRQNNIHLYHLGIDRTIILKMKEKLKILKIFATANDYKNNYLLPSSKVKTNLDERILNQ